MHFSFEDVKRFAAWSADRNPLYLDPEFALETHLGQGGVHGVLAVIESLRLVALPPDRVVKSLDVEFRSAVLVAEAYDAQVRLEDAEVLVLLQHAGQSALTIRAGIGAMLDAPPHVDLSWTASAVGRAVRDNPANPAFSDFEDGLEVVGGYPLTAPASVPAIPFGGITATQARVLALCGYVTGMEMPGLKSLSTRITLTFHGEPEGEAALLYRARAVRFDRRFRILDTELQVADANGRLLATALLRSYVPFSPVRADQAELKARLAPATRQLAGKVALVLGGSRGLGADITAALALAGCHVYASARHDTGGRRDLHRRLTDAGCHVHFLQGDAGDSAWCRAALGRIVAAHGQLDLLVLSACAPPSLMRIEPSSQEARGRYVAENLRLVETPLAVFGSVLDESGGALVLLSSSFAQAAPAGFSHFVAVKQAAEGLVRTTTTEWPNVAGLIVRAPTLQTRWHDTPAGVLGTIPADWVASHLVNHLAKTWHPGAAEFLSEFPAFEPAAHDESSARSPELSIRLAASFTTDPMLASLRFWVKELDLDASIDVAPYGQVLQSFLDPGSLLNGRKRGVNVVLLRVRDWLHELPAEQVADIEFLRSYLQQTARDFEAAARAHRAQATVETLLVMCPSYGALSSAESILLRQTHGDIVTALDGVPGLRRISATDFHESYHVNEDETHDQLRDDIAHIPFRDEYLHVLSTIVVRHVHRQFSVVRKVVVVDCDNTLWRGVVGEVGAEGVEFDAGHHALHATLERLSQSGVLVCLCSKNEEPDVWRVFETRPELRLRRDHVVAAMVNWLPKSQNLRTLAGRLNLGLDSFVFVDDNPVECAEVRAGCPEVLTIQWPQDSVRGVRLLQHVWEFDAGKATQEDARRTEAYKEEFRRQELRAETLTFDDFIKNLGLEVEFSPLAPEDLRRSAQLTLRTNQFNFTTIRREEADVQALAAGGRHEIRTVRVRDRFGDYGLVGLVIAERGQDVWNLDTFLLSCRVLGRGVEHQILSNLGNMAAASGARAVKLRIETTKRNTPARAFLEAVTPEVRRNGDERGLECEVPVEELAAVHFEPTTTGEVALEEEGSSKVASNQPVDASRLRRREEQIARAAFDLGTGPDIRAAIEGRPAAAAAPATATAGDVADVVHAAFAAALRLSPERVAEVDMLEALGCDSLRIVEITVALSDRFPWLPSTLLFEHRSVRQIVDEIVRLSRPQSEADVSGLAGHARVRHLPAAPDTEVAVVGMHLRCAGASSPDELWELLSSGRSAVKAVPVDRPQFLHTLADSRPHWAGLLDDVARFDAEFFGVSPREAEFMDPQLRLLLEVAWGALEDAGSVGAQHEPATGVFAGVMYGDYGFRANMGSDGRNLYRCWEGFSLANRLSQLFGFRGPSFAVDTACSSSGTALHLACNALKAGECKVAVVGGVNLILDPDRFGSLGRLGILSSRGRCEPFGADADGTVLGEGAGVVVLRPLEEALRRGDRVYAVIKGSGLSTGSGTVGFTAPNPQAQSEAILRSLQVAGVDPRTISYVETHGTGTALGDPIEVRGLTLAYASGTLRDPGLEIEHRCTIGSIKPNIGHLEAGAGIMGLIKVLLQFQRKALLPSITSAQASPHIPFAQGPFDVQRQLADWPRVTALVNGVPLSLPRRAGLNSFGVGGANAHVILEEPPEQARAQDADRPSHILALSAISAEALTRQAQRVLRSVERHEHVPIGDLCFSMNAGRRHFSHRTALQAASREDLLRALRAVAADTGRQTVATVTGSTPAKPKIAFLFTGQGSQYAGMGKALYDGQPVFRAALDRCAEVFDRLLDRPLRELLFAEDGTEAAALLDQTGYTQPALFAFEYALAQLWGSWGIQPDVVMGHSVGEIAAMCVAGGVSLEDGLKLIAARGRLMQALPAGGAMTSVMADEARVQEAIAGSLECVAIAAINAPGQIVISGAGTAVAEISARLSADGIKTKDLTVSHAFHSPLMKPMLAEYARVVSEIRFSVPAVPFVSCVDGVLVQEQVTRPEYWLRQVMDPVRFAAGTRALEAEGVSAYVEIGPHPVLLGMARRCVRDDSEASWLPSLRKDADGWRTVLGSVAQLYERGGEIDWVGFDAPYDRRRITAPTYAFSEKKYWLKRMPVVDVADSPVSLDAETSGGATLNRPQVYELAWRRLPELSVSGTTFPAGAWPWLVFADGTGVGAELTAVLERGGATVSVVVPGPAYRAEGRRYQVDPTNPDDFARLWAAVSAGGESPRVVHLWNLDAPHGSELSDSALGKATDLGVLSVVHLAQTLARNRVSRPTLWVVTERAVAEGLSEHIDVAVAQSPAWGLGRTVALEHPDFWGALIDVSYSTANAAAHHLSRELAGGTGEDQVALREAGRFGPRLVAGDWGNVSAAALSPDGTYLVTGGVGAIGLRMAGWLAAHGAHHVVLSSRRGSIDAEAKARISALEQGGLVVSVVPCDVSRPADVDALLSSIAASAHPLRGVVHAAGIDTSIPLAQLTLDNVRAVMASKVMGGWLLHDRTRALPLDLFVSCSSMASVFGAQGRAHYAAANAFLDSLTHERRRLGLATLSVNWGPWRGGGMAGAEQLQQFERVGNLGLDPGGAMSAMDRLVGGPRAQVAVADMDWALFRQVYEARRARPLLAELPRQDSRATGRSLTSDAPWVARLALLPSLERPAGLDALMQQEVADTMGFDDARSVAPDRNFFELGMDSLMMADLVGRLKRQSGVPCSDLVFDHPNVRDLSARLIERLPLEHDEAAPETTVPTDTAAAEGPPADEGMHGYRVDDEPDIFAFQRSAWPHRRADLIPARWRWMYVESARRLGAAPLVWLYRDAGRIVGHMGSIPVRLKLGDEERSTAWLVETMVLEDHRPKAIGLRLMVQSHGDIPFALSLGQTGEMREIQFRLGWKSVAPLEIAQLLIRPEKVLEGKLPKPAALAAGWGIRATTAVRGLVRTRARASVREVDRFEERHDRLWAAAAETLTCAVVRDASYLNWKYVDQPGQDFVRLEVMDGATVVGVAVLLFREPDQAYRYRRAFLADIVVPFSDQRVVAQVVQAAVDAAAERGADAVLCLHVGKPLTRALGACGFRLRTPERFLLVDPGPVSGAPLEQLLSPDSWLVTLGDSDIDRPW